MSKIFHQVFFQCTNLQRSRSHFKPLFTGGSGNTYSLQVEVGTHTHSSQVEVGTPSVFTGGGGNSYSLQVEVGTLSLSFSWLSLRSQLTCPPSIESPRAKGCQWLAIPQQTCGSVTEAACPPCFTEALPGACDPLITLPMLGAAAGCKRNQ